MKNKEKDSIVDDVVKELMKYDIKYDDYKEYKEKINSKYLTVEEYKVIIDLNISPEKYNELKDNNISIHYYKELRNLNISIDECNKLRDLQIDINEFVKYKNNSDINITPNEYFVKNISKEMPKGKTIVMGSIVAGVSAIGLANGLLGSITSNDPKEAIISGFVALASTFPLIIGSGTAIESILTKSDLKMKYKQIMNEDNLVKDNFVNNEQKGRFL